jgi:RHS repeat-associated protein
MPTLTSADSVGRRTSMCDVAGWEAWSYDSRGHVIAERRSTNSVVKSTAYAYNFHGGVTSITYPSGRTINYAYNAAGQTLSATDTANSINYASSAAYNPAGALTSLQEGANLVSTMYYNNRLQPCRISVKNTGTAPTSCADTTTGNVMDMTYGFNYGTADNGNVQSVANNITTARGQTYTYDELNRVSTAKTTATSGTYSWGLQFGYDPWANLLSTSVTQGSAYSLSVYADGSNRIHSTGSTFTYDAAGNLTADPVNSSYTYNAEGELTSAAGVTYTYDGDGDRVQKSSGKLYWYGVGIDPLSESDASGNLTNEYIFLSGARIAMLQLSTNTVNYFVADHLGSSRIVTNSSGSILDDSDFYPYGGERSYSSSSGNNYKFTGKERDTESGLDDFAARFYTSNYGRFLSADESKYAKAADPQTWNLYTYVANNPLNAVDPTGHDPDASLANAPANRYKPMQHAGYIDESLGSGAASGGGSSVSDNSGPSGEFAGLSCISCWYAPASSPTGDIANSTPSDSIGGPHDSGESADPQQSPEKVPVVVTQVAGLLPTDHVVISVNGGTPVGLEPNSIIGAADALNRETSPPFKPASTPGHVEEDHSTGKNLVRQATLYVTKEQAAKMQSYINQSKQQPQLYDPIFHNCATYVEQTLRAGDFPAPSALAPKGLVLELQKMSH